MARYKLTLLFIQVIIQFCSCEINNDEKVKLTNGFVKFYNNLPNQIYKSEEAYLLNAHQTDISNAYDIEAVLKVSDIHNVDVTKYIKCSANIADVDITTSTFEAGMVVMSHKCHDDPILGEKPGHPDVTSPTSNALNVPEVTESTFIRKPIQLDNEVQTNTAVTSGEQFIAVPREEPKVHCIGCSSHVSPQAEGVNELADIGIRQLNSLEPSVQHSLNSVVEVERQVQVVNGIRYILTLIVDYNRCSTHEANTCLTSAACKVTILEKPWMKLPDKSKYRAILSNNCTREWRFGDDGVVIPKTPSDNREDNTLNPSNPEGNTDDTIKPIHVVNVQSSQQTEKILTDEDIKNIEGQIIPNNEFYSQSTANEYVSSTSKPLGESNDNIAKLEASAQYSSDTIQPSKPHNIVNLEDEKKKTIDDLINFFNFAGLDSNSYNEAASRVKRDRTWILDGKKFELLYDEFNTDTETTAKRSLYAQDGLIEQSPQVPGGLQEKDPNSPEYKQLAEESLQKYLQESGNSQPHKITETEKVTVQVVAGTKTIIHFKISPMTPASGDVISCRSEIWEQKWRNFKQIDVKCHIEDTNSRVKRGGIAGGLVEVDPNSPEYKQLAEESLQKYLQESGTSQPHKITEIEKVTVQVVAGTKTIIHFKISPMTPASGDVISCRSEIWEQKWRNFKQIDVKCHIEDTNSRVKRGGIAGGLVEVDPNSPEYKQLAEESLQKYLQESGNSQPHKITAIEKVTVQVVAGTNTIIHFKMSPMTPASGDVISCRSEIWEQKWKNFKQIDVKCHIEDTNSRVKRGGMAGGLVEVDPNSPEYKQLAEESLQKYLQESGNSQPHKITEIEKVTVQVVAGTKTIIHFKISPMTPASGDVISCRSEIWEQKWRNFKQIDVKCHIEDTNSRVKRGGIAGGLVEVDPNSPEYKQLAEESLQKYLQESGTSQPHKITEIEKVTVQVVAGTKTIIHFKISPMTPASGDVISCRSEIWEQKWRNFKQIDVKCHIEDTNSRVKRGGIAGGLVEVDPNSPEYKQLAEESLQKYLQESGTSQPHKITEIEKVTVQVVAGTKTIIHFKISPMTPASGDVISCRSEIWEQKWRNFKQIDVNCNIDNVRSKRNIIVGSVTEQDTNNPKYMLLAEQSLEKYLSDSGNIESLKVVGIDKVTTQMVAGIKTIIYFNIAPKASNVNVIKCKAGIMEQPWLNITEINVDCKDDKQPKRNKREIKKFHSNDKKSVGAVHEEDPTKFEYKLLAEESLTKYKKRQKNYNSHVVAKVKKVTTQVVVGIRYTIDFVAAPSLCADDVSYCDINTLIDCHAIVRHQSWLEHKDIDISCNIPHRNSKRNTSLRNANQLINNESRQRRSISLDSTNATDVEFQSTPLAQALAERALIHIEAKYPHPRKQKVTRIFSLNKQVVAGVHYRMKIEVGLTNCSALSNQTYCKIDTKGGGANKFCTVKIWLRPLMDNPPNYRVTCDNQEGAMAEMYHHMQAEYLFRDFLTTYMPDYINDHDKISQRFEIFKANVQKIHDLNTHERGTASYGVTRFTDLTYEEFTSKHLGLKPNLRDDNQVPMRKAVIPSGDIPENFDWRDKGAVTEVKNQGSCGSCWAFSVTGNIEGQWKLKSGQLVSLSEQELVDCDTMDSGCNGGMPDNAYRAIEQLGGLETENDYPYEGEDDKCTFNKTLSRVQISGALNISSNETDMAKWLVANGPISIGINANAMQFYMGGVSHPWRMLCSPSNLDHGVLVVGYGVKSYPLFKKRLPYWIIKNSWGPSWGEQGYYRVYRGDGTCGVNQMASSAVV